MVMFGDPTHHSGASYNAGTANTDGVSALYSFSSLGNSLILTHFRQLFDRDDISACEALGPALVSYCDTGDIYCNRGRDGERDDLDVHGEYFEIYDEEVLDFVLSRYEGGSGDGNATITRPEATGDDDNDESAAMAVGAKLEYLLPIGLASLWMLM
jgi:acetylxylan esterase